MFLGDSKKCRGAESFLLFFRRAVFPLHYIIFLQMPKKKNKGAIGGKGKKKVDSDPAAVDVDRQVGYSLELASSLAELKNYDPVAASFLQRTIYNGDYWFTLSVALRSDVPVDSIAPVKVSGAYGRGLDPSVVGMRVADVLWQEINISTYGWNRRPNDKASVKYLRASLPPPDEADAFVQGYSFPTRQDMTASDFWNCHCEATRRYEIARSAIAGKIGHSVKPETIRKLEENFARMSGELTSLAERLTVASPGGHLDERLDEYLFPGSSEEIEVCTQHASNGNRKSLICATATHTFALLFETS